MLLVNVFILPLPTYCGSELPKSDDILVEGTGEGVFCLLSVSLRILQKVSTLFFISFFEGLGCMCIYGQSITLKPCQEFQSVYVKSTASK